MTVSPTCSVPTIIVRLYAMICAVLLIPVLYDWMDFSAFQYKGFFFFLERSLLGTDKARIE